MRSIRTRQLKDFGHIKRRKTLIMKNNTGGKVQGKKSKRTTVCGQHQQMDRIYVERCCANATNLPWRDGK